MNKPLTTASTNTLLSPDILALKPRQVLLLKPDMALKDSADRDAAKPTLKPDQKALLHRLIGQYFNRSGFSKTAKKFISEAEIEKKDLSDDSISLEEIFQKHLDYGNHGAKDISRDVIEDTNGTSKKDTGNESLADEKKKKKKQKKLDATEDHTIISAEASKEATDKISSDDHEKKHKDKKKKKNKSGSKAVDDVKPEEQGEGQSSEMKHDSETEGKPKRKKKKNKNESKEEPDITEVEKVDGGTENESDKPKSKKRKSDNKTADEHEVQKASKKQKRSEAEENDEQAVDDKKTPEKQPDGQENRDSEKSGAKSATEKSAKKLQNGSKEPKKPFQRVNVEEVVFTDERLQDNSYWAKGGADTGYGAKAQEVLGQVRGRDFRHEKTKKKRGSYRGGMIDLQTHSVKFDNSDEE